MRTSLTYSVIKEDKWRDGKEVSVVKFRGFDFSVSSAKSEEEHICVLRSFQEYLERYGFVSDVFGNGSWDEYVRMNDTKSYAFLNIPVVEVEEKEEIKELYKEWKNNNGKV